MDNLGYNYVANTNKLNYVTDAVTAATPADYTDIKNQSANNYDYDAIGNLVKDNSESITNIDWNVYGKIKSITKTGTSISYTYDASGNRISKDVNGIYTFYVRDASGNVMSIYEKVDTLKQKEINLYGSSRLGVYNVDVNVQNCNAALPEITIFTRGNKFFELSNHLGNVLATVSDKKIQHTTDGTTIDYYNADVVTAQDYYPFGMQMPGRKYSIANTNYRYGFNGKENDNEVKGEGNQQDYGMRIYDPRIGRFLSVDPITAKYPELTPYQFASNRPIDGIDLDGLEYRKAPGAVGVRMSLSEKNGEQVRNDYGYLIPKNLPQFYKSIGATTQQKFETSFNITKTKLDQLNPPQTLVTTRADAIESTLQYVAQVAAGLTPEVKAYEEMKSQLEDLNTSIDLVVRARSSKLLPDQFKNDLYFVQNLANYVFDGSLTASGPDKQLAAYNGVIKAIGDEIYQNRDEIFSQTYKRKTSQITPIYQKQTLDFLNYAKPKIIGALRTNIDAPYKQALDNYNNVGGNGIGSTMIKAEKK